MIDFTTQLKPFFQVLVFKVNAQFDQTVFLAAFRNAIDLKNNATNKHYFEIQNENRDPDSVILHLIHKSFPTWYINPNDILKAKAPGEHEDLENDLVIFYKTDDYLFIYSSCAQVETLLLEAIQTLKEKNNWVFKKLSHETINHILKQLDMEYRTLGMANVFNAGGSAPESKTYSGRNTSYSLTPSFDSGYGFSYCLGSIFEKGGKRKPFGCSVAKSKVWKTWVNDANDFIVQCDQILKWMKNPATAKKTNLDILVLPVSKSKIQKASPIEFYLDYFVHDKGMVQLSSRSIETFDWSCYLSPGKKNLITFELKDWGKEEKIEAKFSYDATKELYSFEWANPTETIKIKFIDDEKERTTSRDVIQYLTAQQGFTIIYSNGYAYRNGECYQDNRLTEMFNSCCLDISWSDVDIRKEDKPAKAKGKKFNIIEKITAHLSGTKYIVCINDNGANEIADCVYITDDKIVLIHAKFSKSHTVGLRVDDMQVVASQAIKNIRYFASQAYTTDVFDRLFKKCPPGAFKDGDHFQESIIEKLQDNRIKRECWVVQPGISSSRLNKQKNNKLHPLLNFVYSIFKMNQIDFKLYCSS